jgi:two-component system chemotaxis response regulator CheY
VRTICNIQARGGNFSQVAVFLPRADLQPISLARNHGVERQEGAFWRLIKQKVISMGIKALIADDSGVMRKIIVRAANAAGIQEIIEAVDGVDAINKFGAEHFDLVLTDWNMPNKTGLEVIQEIRATGSTVPIIMVTTEGEKASVLQAIQAGVSDYLTKPFEADALLAKIEKLAIA